MLLSPFSFELRLVVRLGVNYPELQLTWLAIDLMRFTAHGFQALGSSNITLCRNGFYDGNINAAKRGYLCHLYHLGFWALCGVDLAARH